MQDARIVSRAAKRVGPTENNPYTLTLLSFTIARPAIVFQGVIIRQIRLNCLSNSSQVKTRAVGRPCGQW